MKVGYVCLHYGTCYLEWSIKSVIDDLDRLYVLYSPEGSHGHKSNHPCPDKRADLLAAAQRGAGSKLEWVDAGVFGYEGQHRDTIHKLVPNADVIVRLDYDEIYPSGLLKDILFQVEHTNARRYRIPFVHFYRSFYGAILHDPAFPEIVTVPSRADSETTLQTRPVAHMGYAIPAYLMRYKLSIHGHKNELRMGADEYTDGIYLNRQRTTDLHPVGSDHWNISRVDPMDYMPRFMMEHPYFYKGLIE